MAKRSTSIPSYRRKRKGRGFFGWLFRIVVGLILFSAGQLCLRKYKG